VKKGTMTDVISGQWIYAMSRGVEERADEAIF
jgi:hypothetical protein